MRGADERGATNVLHERALGVALDHKMTTHGSQSQRTHHDG